LVAGDSHPHYGFVFFESRRPGGHAFKTAGKNLVVLNLKASESSDGYLPRIAVLGIGGAGGNAVRNMIEAGLEGVTFIVAEAADDDLKKAALSLADKIDAVLPTSTVAEAEAWKFAVYPFADATRGFTHMPTLRAAIKSRQKLHLDYRRIDGVLTARTIRPLNMEYWGRVWTLTAWCETRDDFRVFRVDLIEAATALPELFVDEPGKRLADYSPE